MFRQIGFGRNYQYESAVPRGPSSAWALYVQDHYRRARKRLPWMYRRNQQRVFKLCYNFWKSESEKVKARYNKWAQLDKERAKRQRLEYRKEVEKGRARYVPLRRTKPRPPGFPMRTRNSFVFYAAETRPVIRKENPDMMPADMMKALSKRWKALSLDKKKPYLERCKADKARFKAQKRQFRETEKQRQRLERIAKIRMRLNKAFHKPKVPRSAMVITHK